MPATNKTSPTRAKRGDSQTSSVPATAGDGGNSASTVIEAPQRPVRDKLDPHAFPDGGGSGGAEAFSRKKLRK